MLVNNATASICQRVGGKEDFISSAKFIQERFLSKKPTIFFENVKIMGLIILENVKIMTV